MFRAYWLIVYQLKKISKGIFFIGRKLPGLMDKKYRMKNTGKRNTITGKKILNAFLQTLTGNQ
jgi:hypothetical protein